MALFAAMRQESERGFSKGVQLMLLATFLFTLMNVFVKLVPHIPVMEIILFRSIISLVISASYLKYHRIPLLGNNKKYLWMRGIFGVTALVLFFTTLKYIPLGSAVTLRYLTPVFTALFGIAMLGEKVQKVQWSFFGISLLGVFLVKGFDPRISWFHFMLGLGSCLSSGIAYNAIRKMKGTDHPMVVILYFPMVAIPICTIYAFYDWVTPQGWDWVYLLLIGLLTQFAQYFMTKAYHSDKVAKVSSVNYFGLFFALGFGITIFHETYSFKILLGMALVVSGVLLNLYFKRIKGLSG